VLVLGTNLERKSESNQSCQEMTEMCPRDTQLCPKKAGHNSVSPEFHPGYPQLPSAQFPKPPKHKTTRPNSNPFLLSSLPVCLDCTAALVQVYFLYSSTQSPLSYFQFIKNQIIFQFVPSPILPSRD